MFFLVIVRTSLLTKNIQVLGEKGVNQISFLKPPPPPSIKIIQLILIAILTFQFKSLQGLHIYYT